MSGSTIDRMLHFLEFTRKKRLHTTEKSQQQGLNFWGLVKNILASYLMNLDESKVNLVREVILS
jgi:hypothetical protein